MSALLLPALAAGSSGQGALYVDDVFSAYTYTGNGATQTINNGIDLTGKGGLVWCKQRSGIQNHVLFDSARGASNILSTDTTGGNSVGYPFSLTSTGFSFGTYSGMPNTSSATYTSWTFRKAPKFFDVVTYTGNGTSNRQIAHSLGVQAGFVTVKATSATGDWNSYHRSATGDLKLNLTDAQTASRAIITAADASTFTVSGAANTNGVSYVAYLWAHDPSAEGIIQCGSFTTNGSGNATVELGWEPQYLLTKLATNSPGNMGNANWIICDSMRGFTASNYPRILQAESTSGEYERAIYINPNSTGFRYNGGYASQTYIYLAIRRPNKPPTSGTQVYTSSTASGVITTDFPVDLHISATRTGDSTNHRFHDRLRGGTKELVSSSTAAESTVSDLLFDSNSGLRTSFASGLVNHFFRRAPGFFDVVCYTGNGASGQQVSHSLGVKPQLIIRKAMSSASDWRVYSETLGATKYISLDTAPFGTSAVVWNDTEPNSTIFTNGILGTAAYVAYLFATKSGISKVGSYTGNGSSQTINCGFSTGARFILIKRTDSTGDWYVWDTARGIVAANDPHLSLNTTAAEVTTDDSIDPASVGFIVNQNAATNINVTGANYIFLAIA